MKMNLCPKSWHEEWGPSGLGYLRLQGWGREWSQLTITDGGIFLTSCKEENKKEKTMKRALQYTDPLQGLKNSLIFINLYGYKVIKQFCSKLFNLFGKKRRANTLPSWMTKCVNIYSLFIIEIVNGELEVRFYFYKMFWICCLYNVWPM